MSNNKTKVITIYSPSGGGKTIVTSEWQKRISKSSALFFDDRDYDVESGIGDLCKWYAEGADVNRYNLKMLANDIDQLLKEDIDYIFLDYPFGYQQKQIASYIDFSIYINTPLDYCSRD